MIKNKVLHIKIMFIENQLKIYILSFEQIFILKHYI